MNSQLIFLFLSFFILFYIFDSDQFLCEGLPSFNPKGFYYSYAWCRSLCEERISFWTGFIFRKLCRFLLVFDWRYFNQCLTCFSSINHLLRLYARFFILFNLMKMRFSRSTHLLMCLSLETNAHHRD